jgi:catalase
MPASYRTMDGFGVHAFRLVNAQGQQVFAKFHWKSQQGLKGMTLEQMKAADTNYATRDLYGTISAGNFPKWDLYVQLLTWDDIQKLDFDGFDDTKEWPGVPEVKIGTMTLNKVPDNWFEYTEESAFAPSNMVPGIEPSPDRMLQGRLFAYADTQRYRLGTNFEELPANRPLVQVANNNQDGAMQSALRTGDVNYDPTNAAGNPAEQPDYRYSQYKVEGLTQTRPIDKQDNFRQAGDYYRKLSKADQDDLIKNLAADLVQMKNEPAKDLFISHFYRADKDYGTRLAAAAKADLATVAKLAAN